MATTGVALDARILREGTAAQASAVGGQALVTRALGSDIQGDEIQLAEYWMGGRRDQDRDGIPNRYDRDRDGDGIPNRWDRNPNRPNYPYMPPRNPWQQQRRLEPCWPGEIPDVYSMVGPHLCIRGR